MKKTILFFLCAGRLFGASPTIAPEDGAVIEQIIHTLAATSLIKLSIKKQEIRSLGYKIDGKVDAFQFLGYILSKPTLRADFCKVRESALKWRGVMHGLNKGLDRLHKEGRLDARFSEFAAEFNLEPVAFKRVLEEKKWEDFVALVLEKTAAAPLQKTESSSLQKRAS